MALRVHEGPAARARSASVGDRVEFSAKVENKAALEESVLLTVEGLKEGALARPVAFTFVFDPPAASLRPKTRTVVVFTWIAALPEGKDAFTFRGELVLRKLDGSLVGKAPLDLYVRK